MIHGTFSFDELLIPDTEICLAMGYDGQTPERFILDLIGEVKREIASLCRVRYMYQVVESRLLGPYKLHVQDHIFHIGRIISSYLRDTTHACLFLVTAGAEYDTYLDHLRREQDTVREFIADAIGSVLAEACVERIRIQLSQTTSLKQTLPYSPGYCGWNINEQRAFFELFPGNPCGILLNESNLMSPVKSVSGIIGLGEDLVPQPYHCEICTNRNCYKRKNLRS